MKSIIIEDEAISSRNLERILADLEPPIQVIGKAGSIDEAKQLYSKLDHFPDIIFSDIKLTDGLSFSIFKECWKGVPVIFITAFDNYALEAFRTNGIGYLLKPYLKEDLEKALSFIKSIKKETTAIPYEQLINLLEKKTNYRKTFLVPFQDKLIQLKANEVHWIYSSNEICYAHTYKGKQHILEGTLEKLESELDPETFFRANRQFIINRNSILEIHLYFNSRLSLELTPQAPEKVIISKAKVTAFKKWLGA